jgi:hypothetical protein
MLLPCRAASRLSKKTYGKATKTTLDPCSLDLPSVGALVRFYHTCLAFPVKQTWLDAAKAGNLDTFDGLTYSNIAWYCPGSDKTILDHLPSNARTSAQHGHVRLGLLLACPSLLSNPLPRYSPLTKSLSMCSLSASSIPMTQVVSLSGHAQAASIL